MLSSVVPFALHDAVTIPDFWLANDQSWRRAAAVDCSCFPGAKKPAAFALISSCRCGVSVATFSSSAVMIIGFWLLLFYAWGGTVETNEQ
jgi:hypothetical protein